MAIKSPFDDLVDALAERVATVVVERLRAGSPGMIDQNASPLGRRKHCAAVKKRVARGEDGASIVGRRHLLTPEALQTELTRATGRTPNGELTSAEALRLELEREIRLACSGVTDDS